MNNGFIWKNVYYIYFLVKYLLSDKNVDVVDTFSYF